MAGKRQCLRLSMIFISSLAVWTTVGAMARPVQDASMSVLHERWMAQYGRVYKDGNEKARRFEIFKANAEYVESVNRAGNRTYKLGLNQFADLTTAEFDSSHLGYRPSHDLASTMPTAFRYAALGDEDVPDSVDWRARGAVTPVKDQGHCASCWAFSAVGAMEGLVEMTSGQLISLSEQELLDCIGGDHDVCHDGNMVDAFQFVVSNGGITTEDNYPYQQAQGSCNTGEPSVAHIGGYQRVPKNDEAALMKAVANQPVSVAVATHGTDFRLYSGGVFTGSCDTTLSHAVLAVGYGTADDGTKYWLLKNQWGTSWGEGGYMRLQRGADAPEGLCGVAMDPSYPTV